MTINILETPTCITCGKRFKSRRSLAPHIRMQHTDAGIARTAALLDAKAWAKPHTCKICGLEVANLHALSQHVHVDHKKPSEPTPVPESGGTITAQVAIRPVPPELTWANILDTVPNEETLGVLIFEGFMATLMRSQEQVRAAEDHAAKVVADSVATEKRFREELDSAARQIVSARKDEKAILAAHAELERQNKVLQDKLNTRTVQTKRFTLDDLKTAMTGLRPVAENKGTP